MESIKDDRGYNQGFKLVPSTTVRMKRRAQAFIQEMDTTRNISILEIGCGTGEISYWIAEQTKEFVLGTDLCVPFIEQAKSKFQLANLQYEVLNFNQPESLSGKKFDYVIGNGILHHLFYNLDEALKNIRHLLKPNGSILFFEPNIYNPYCALIFKIPYLRVKAQLEPAEMAFSKRFIVQKLFRAHFNDVSVRYKDFLIPGVPKFFIQPLILAGAVIEQIPILKMTTQSLFIKARKNGE